MEDRIKSLDGIRAVAVSLVLMHHLADWSNPIARDGRFGVDVFFVLSGFLITLLLCREEGVRGEISLKKFYLRRAFRILPPAFFYLAIVAALAVIGWDDAGPFDIAASALFFRNFWMEPWSTSHFWSLSVEEQFYLLWPLLFLLLGNNRRRLYFGAVLVCLAPFWRNLMYRLAGGAVNVFMYRSDLHFDALLMGCCLALLRSDPEWGKSKWIRVAGSAWSALVAVAVMVAAVGRHWPNNFLAATVALASVAVVLNACVESRGGWLGAILSNAPIVWVGRISYSLYLWQQLFCFRSLIPWAGQFPQNLACAVAMACVSYYGIEQPALRLRKRLMQESKSAPLAVAA